jgi:hypothetical protein
MTTKLDLTTAISEQTVTDDDMAYLTRQEQLNRQQSHYFARRDHPFAVACKNDADRYARIIAALRSTQQAGAAAAGGVTSERIEGAAAYLCEELSPNTWDHAKRSVRLSAEWRDLAQRVLLAAERATSTTSAHA